MIVVAIFMSLPYLADRLISPRLTGIVSTLIFPLSFVAVDYLKTLLYPFGSIGSLAYTQYGNLPLLQLVSITGISGIVFCQKYHNLAKKGFYASVGELGDDMRQEN